MSKYTNNACISKYERSNQIDGCYGKSIRIEFGVGLLKEGGN